MSVEVLNTKEQYGDTYKIPQRILNNIETVEGLKYILKTTSYKDDDIRAEIRQEIEDLKHWNIKAKSFYDINFSKGDKK